jgi:hypothetical protein
MQPGMALKDGLAYFTASRIVSLAMQVHTGPAAAGRPELWNYSCDRRGNSGRWVYVTPSHISDNTKLSSPDNVRRNHGFRFSPITITRLNRYRGGTRGIRKSANTYTLACDHSTRTRWTCGSASEPCFWNSANSYL